MKPSSTKTVAVEIPMSEELVRYLDNISCFLENETGRKVSTESIINRIISKGLPLLEADIQRMRAKANESAKRFPKLQLAFSNTQ